MTNIYQVLNIHPNSNIIRILEAYKNKCLNNPERTIEYTSYLSILCDEFKRLAYNANLYKISITSLFQINEMQREEIDEYELIPYIEWLSMFKDYFYETKYYTNNEKFHQAIEIWYDNIERIIEQLKERIHSIYLN